MLNSFEDFQLVKKIGNWEIELKIVNNFVEDSNSPDWYGFKRIDLIKKV